MSYNRKLNSTDINNRWFFFLPFLVIVASCLQLIYSSTSGITPDSLDYIKIAKYLPEITQSLFPILYPFLIKMSYFITHDYFWATKLISFAALVFTFWYPFYKKFMWKEIWVIVSFPTFLTIYYCSWSETILIPLLIVFSHINYQYLNENKSKNFLLKNTIAMTLMLLTKYSSMGIIFGYALFILFLYVDTKRYSYKLIWSLLITVVIFTFYLGFNYITTGSKMGERIPEMKSGMNIRYSFFRIIYNLNPILNDRLIFNFTINYIFLAAITVIGYIPIVYITRNIFWKNKTCILFFIISFTFLFFTIISYFTVKLDNLDGRLLMLFVFFILISLAIAFKNISINNRIKNILMYCIFLGLLINISNTIYKLKYRQIDKINIINQINNV
jgi:hypothetical protein